MGKEKQIRTEMRGETGKHPEGRDMRKHCNESHLTQFNQSGIELECLIEQSRILV
jgi:hypothetical protein